MKYFALYVSKNTYHKYVEAVKECETEIVYPLGQVNNMYLVKYVYGDPVPNSTTIFTEWQFRRDFWLEEAHSYLEWFEVSI